ncbi:MAG: SPOR domain-containing protein, partial [Gemmatimonadota bacterium]
GDPRGDDAAAEEPADGGGADGTGADTAAGPEVEAGGDAFFVVVVSSRDSAAVARAVEGIEAGDRPARVRHFRDDRERMWWRGMVGPYEDREAAEDRAGELGDGDLETDPWVGRFPVEAPEPGPDSLADGSPGR